VKKPRTQKPWCCECRKSTYPTKAAAMSEAHAMVRAGKHLTRTGYLTGYPCPEGRGWHVGHRSNPQRRR